MKFSERLLAPYSVAMLYGADTPFGTIDSGTKRAIDLYNHTSGKKTILTQYFATFFKFHTPTHPPIMFLQVLAIFTTRKRSLRRLCFYTCLSFCPRGGGIPACLAGLRGRGLQAHTQGEVEGSGQGGLQTHTLGRVYPSMH